MKTFFISLACLWLSIVSGFGWGAEGHQAIAEAAISRLPSTTKAKVTAILSASKVAEISDIVTAATWPDDIRLSAHPGKYVNTAGGKSFNKRFVGNRVWHFVDYPLDGTYTLTGTFSTTNDVVHIIGHCIDVLEGTATGDWAKMQKEEALSWLIHVVGDLHQPLHTGEGFYNFNGTTALLITDPTQAAGKPDDGGGNALHFGSNNFHSFWDDNMVAHISTKESVVVSTITNMLKTATYSNPGSNYRDWPVAWACASIQEAKFAYQGIVEGNEVGQKDPNSSNINIQFSTSAYENTYDEVAREQLAKAAYDLADLLEHIKWQ